MMREVNALMIALLVAGTSSASAQDLAGQTSVPLRERLAQLEESYELAAGVIQRGGVDSALATKLDAQKRDVGLRQDRPDKFSAYAQRWRQIHSLLGENLDLLAAMLRQPPTQTSAPQAAAHLRLRADSIRRNRRTPLVSDITAYVLEELSASFSVLDSVGGVANAQSLQFRRFTEFSQLYDAFRFYRDRLLNIAEEACRARDPLCAEVDPSRTASHLAFVASGYSNEMYGAGVLVSLSRIFPPWGHRRVVGAQVFSDLPGGDEIAVEVSGGSVFGDFVLMPGVIISPRSHRALGLSGSVSYLARSRLSLGASFSTDYGLGLRVIYGMRPASAGPR